VAGWFRDQEKAANLATRNEAEGIYTTLNPCQDALVGRADHRLKAGVNRTKDDEIEKIQNLLVDLDPTRPEGISSTDAEHQAALEMAQIIRADLVKEGWPEPLVGDSGNGAHLIYPLDLLNNEESRTLVKAISKALSLQYQDHLARLNLEVDQMVFNPGRLTKLYGTMVRKGDNTPDRPHRLAKIISLPKTRQAVPLDLLKKMAATIQSQEKTQAKKPEAGAGRFDVEAYLTRYGMEVVMVKPHGGGFLYCLRECLFDSSHSDNEAAIGQAEDGKLFFQCFHNSCKGRTWAEARAKISGQDKLTEFIIGAGNNKNRNQNKPQKQGTDEEPTQQEILLTIAGAAELFYTSDDESFARIPFKGHLETWSIRGGGFKKWLLHGFYKLQGKAPQAEIFSSTIKLLEAKALFEGPLRPVWVRVAEDEDAIYLDLRNDSWEAVKITKDGWEMVADPPVCFRRSKSMLPLPYPERGGSLNELRPFVNVATVQDFRLVIAYQLAAMRARGPYPIMVVNGEQGSAKSTMARANRSLMDPNTSPLRSAPREERDLMISATNSWTLAFDNLSGMPPWLSDSFCRLSTGGGISNRELYTNGEEFILDAMRPVILNGIDSLTERPDLADRALIFNLPQILDDARRSEKQFWADFERTRPRILGALLDAVSMGLRNQSSVKLPTLPRMADFALWVVACEPALPWPPGSFMAAYLENRSEAVELSLEADCVAVAVREHMADRYIWTGKPSELYEELEKRVSENTKRSKAWPKAPNKLSGRLKRAATFLRAIGIDVEIGWSKSKGREIVIRRIIQSKETTVGTEGTVESEKPCEFSSHDTKNGTVGTDEPTVGTQEPRGRTSHDTDDFSHGPEKEPWDGKGNNHEGFHDTHGSHDTLHTLDGELDADFWEGDL